MHDTARENIKAPKRYIKSENNKHMPTATFVNKTIT